MAEPTPRIPEAVKELAKHFPLAIKPRLEAAVEAIAPLLCAGLEEERDKAELLAGDRGVELELAESDRKKVTQQLAKVRAEVERLRDLAAKRRDEAIKAKPAAAEILTSEAQLIDFAADGFHAILDSSSPLSGDGEERGEEEAEDRETALGIYEAALERIAADVQEVGTGTGELRTAYPFGEKAALEAREALAQDGAPASTQQLPGKSLSSPSQTNTKGGLMEPTDAQINDLKLLETWRGQGKRVIAVDEADLPAVLDWFKTGGTIPPEVNRLLDTLEGANQAAHNAVGKAV